MVFGIIGLIFLYILYELLINGNLWKLILCVFGWIGLHNFLASNTHITSSGVSWDIIVPTLIVIFALAYTKAE
jgi:hypothetical protein